MRLETNFITMLSGIDGDTLDNVIFGQLPKRIILGFIITDTRLHTGWTRTSCIECTHIHTIMN